MRSWNIRPCEIFPVLLDLGFQKFATNSRGTQLYAKTIFGSEKYPLNRSRKEKLAKNSESKYYYATYSNKESFYPRCDLLNEYAYKDPKDGYLIALTYDGKPKAPLLKSGRVNYAKVGNKEILYELNRVPFFGLDVSGNQQYPLDENMDEYYPVYNSCPLIAKDSSGRYKYALNCFQKIIFPVNQNGKKVYINEYLKNTTQCALEEQSENFESYIENWYPLKQNRAGRSEIIINNILLPEQYPIDMLGNEFTNENGDIISSLGYPITNDNFIILPNRNNKPIIQSNDEHLLKRIKYLLYRPFDDTYDFLTDVRSNRNASSAKKKYDVLTLADYKKKTWDLNNYVICGLIVLIFILLILNLAKYA